MQVEFYPLGDNGVLIELGPSFTEETHQHVQMVAAFLEQVELEWLIEFSIAVTSVTVFYCPVTIANMHSINPYEYVCQYFKKALVTSKTGDTIKHRLIRIPVCYGGEFGPDLENVANYHQLSTEEVIKIHTESEYFVYMIGFAPGFPYLGGLPDTLATPRLETPRLKIPARSVGIGGGQTGVYPISTPGGWQIIGCTPLELFTPEKEIPSLLRSGDKVQFYSISPSDYSSMRRIIHD
ncbi:5-oxoprolinase subunit PxpB [Cytobacillus spongiae]|jgi:inhibitor of KinA|uniref:5-oxoprolinase subunit PxpB n=1 Tax=Cytobacillus spongiae TaxID=2901381 RepID=UPI001F43193E|nr:5-oxoprolinase subunit PxpB [Cytobacillus spongiae]UII54355.1 5-oxoprolinase subunit PxpB [Cytobacillus spongiae]